MKHDLELTGLRVKALRVASGMSQDDFGYELSVSQALVSRWEIGETIPSINNVIYIVDLFGGGVDWVLGSGEEIHSESRRLSLKAFGENLSAAMDKAGIGRCELAGLSGARVSYISDWLYMKSLPSTRSVCKISDAIDVSVRDLLTIRKAVIIGGAK